MHYTWAVQGGTGTLKQQADLHAHLLDAFAAGESSCSTAQADGACKSSNDLSIGCRKDCCKVNAVTPCSGPTLGPVY